jgi:curli biogenesis system outer membrane secretion channel CsgG
MIREGERAQAEAGVEATCLCASRARPTVSRRRALAFLVAAALLRSTTGAGASARPTVAVLYFDYEGKNPELEPLRKGLAQMLTTDVADLEAVRIVERTRLEEVLAELALGASAKIDRASAARIGKLLGAKALVLGAFFEIAGAIRIDARIVEVETGRVVTSVGAQGKADDALACEAALADKLRSALEAFAHASSSEGRGGTSNDRGTRGAASGVASRESRPKVKVSALAAYGRALSAIDRNDRGGARTALEAAVRISPGFAVAAGELAKLSP